MNTKERKNTMNRKLFLFTLAAMLLFTSCEKMCKYSKHPKDLKPIDWNNYNDVYTVFWNCNPCSEAQKLDRDTIMVCGFIQGNQKPSSGDFSLMNEPNADYINPHVYVLLMPDSTGKNITLPDAIDITKKCYIRGKLEFNWIQAGICCSTEPQVFVYNVNDIYFK